MSREGEEVMFPAAARLVFGEKPKVHEWLTRVEATMRTLLAALLQAAIRAALAMAVGSGGASLAAMAEFVAWVDAYPTQIVILARQVLWSQQVEAALAAGGRPKNMETTQAQIGTLLADMADRVLLELPLGRCKKYKQLITDMVHQRDVTRSLIDEGITSETDFLWLYQLRY